MHLNRDVVVVVPLLAMEHAERVPLAGIDQVFELNRWPQMKRAVGSFKYVTPQVFEERERRCHPLHVTRHAGWQEDDGVVITYLVVSSKGDVNLLVVAHHHVVRIVVFRAQSVPAVVDAEQDVG